MQPRITMYATEWCGHCRRLKAALAAEGIDVDVVDADADPGISARIAAATGGLRIVPTLDVGGALLVNPTVAEVRAAVAP